MNTHKVQPDSDVGYSEAGYMVVAALLLVLIAAIAAGSAAGVLGGGVQTIKSTTSRNEEYFKNERVLGEVLQWLRDHDSGMTDVFSRSKFYSTFARRSAAVGSNDQGTFQIRTKLGPVGDPAKSVILVSDPILLRSSASSTEDGYFPLGTDTANGSSFDPLASLKSTPLSGKKVRITLVDAVASDPSKDFGAAGATPQTDFQPLYRIDVLDRVKVERNGGGAGQGARTYFKDQGGQLYGHVLGALQYDFGIGFYGRDGVDVRQPCDSYLSNNGAYASSSARANCSIGSNASIGILNNTKVYGSVRTNGAIDTVAPFGGAVCADLTCSSTGTTCQGSSCQVAGLPAFDSWSSYCPTNRGAVTPTSGSTLTVTGNNASQRCWSKVTINNNRVVTLTTTAYPYFIDELDIANNGRLNFSPDDGTGTITLYVRTITGNRFNGNQVYNINNKPYQLRLNYLGSNALLLNGTVNMSSFITAPAAAVSVQGNFTFSGGIKATALTFTGNGALHFDESGDITTLKGMSYQVRNITQMYRNG
jgi:hypothetical protein